MAQIGSSDSWDETYDSFDPDDFDFVIAQIRFPEIAEQLSELERLSERRQDLADEIDDLRDAKERTDEDLQEVAREIRAFMNDS